MAISYQGTRVLIDPKKIPSGIQKEAVTPFYDQDYNSYKWTFAIDKASVESSNPTDTFNSLIVFLGTAIQSKLANDLIATNTVDSYGDLYEVKSNLCTDQDPDNSDAYKNVAPAYICKVNVKVKIS